MSATVGNPPEPRFGRVFTAVGEVNVAARAEPEPIPEGSRDAVVDAVAEEIPKLNAVVAKPRRERSTAIDCSSWTGGNGTAGTIHWPRFSIPKPIKWLGMHLFPRRHVEIAAAGDGTGGASPKSPAEGTVRATEVPPPGPTTSARPAEAGATDTQPEAPPPADVQASARDPQAVPASSPSPAVQSTAASSLEKPAERPAPASGRPSRPIVGILVESVPYGASQYSDSGPVHVSGGAIGQYARAVNEAGAQVHWLTNDGRSVERQLEEVDGILMPGGRDIDMHFRFDVWQCKMLQQAMRMKLPVRGICRGMQMLNIARNGTLMNDIRSDLGRSYKYVLEHTYGQHPIAIIPTSEFGRQMQTQLIALASSHHQAIKKLSDDFYPVAHSADGIVEAIEKKDDPTVIGVQFHPERAADEIRKPFFNAFVRDASQYRVRVGGAPRAAMEVERPTASPTSLPAVASSPSRVDDTRYVRYTSASSTPTSYPSVERPAVAEHSHSVLEQQGFRQPAPLGDTHTAAGANAGMGSTAPAPHVKIESYVDRNVRLFEEGFRKMKEQNLTLVATNSGQRLDQDVIDRRYGKVYTGFPYAVWSGDANRYLFSVQGSDMEEFLLQLTEEGRQHLQPQTREILGMVSEVLKRGERDVPLGEVFRKKGFWWKKPRLQKDIEVVWAMKRGDLLVQYADKTIGHQERRVDSIDKLRGVMDEIRKYGVV